MRMVLKPSIPKSLSTGDPGIRLSGDRVGMAGKAPHVLSVPGAASMVLENPRESRVGLVCGR